MPYDFPLFFRGDIADVVDSIPVTDKNINNIRKTLLTAKPFKVIILRQLDNRLYLVAVCKEAAGKTNLKVDTNKYPLYVKVLSFYSIDECSLRLCRDIYPNKNKCLVVAEIYDLHNKLIEKRKSEQREKRRKEWEKVQKSKKLRRAKKEKQKAIENQYKMTYEIATMNNDIQRMKKIESIVGYAPGRSGPGSKIKNRNGKILYSDFNPRPCSGGKFSPK